MAITIYNATKNPEPAFNFKTFVLGLGVLRQRHAVIAVAPQFVAVQTSGRRQRYHPYEQAMIEIGWKPMGDITVDLPSPDPHWTTRTRSNGTIQIRYQDEDFHTSSFPAPHEWHRAARDRGTVIGVYIREDAPKVITADQLVRTVGECSGLTLVMPYNPVFGD